MTTTTDNWPDGIPRDYEEMIRKYGALIANEIRRKNVVAAHFEDHYQSVCEKLVAARVLENFVARVQSCSDDDLPATMTGEEACRLYGIGFGAWRSAEWSYQRVFLQLMSGKAPDGANAGMFTKPDGKGAYWRRWMPTPIEGGYSSPCAVYRTSEVLEVNDPARVTPIRGMKFTTASWPRRTVQPHHFVSYMLRAVHNHFSNACRTIMRRQKDRPGDFFSQYKTPDGEFDRNWEDGLPDQMNTAASIEASVDLTQAFETACRMTEAQRGEIGALLKSHSIVEAVRMSSLGPDQKRKLLSICDS
jgi:hypothetical protein